MANLSSADKAKLASGKAKAERWTRERLRPAFNKVDKDGQMVQCRLRGIVFSESPYRAEETIHPDKIVSADNAATQWTGGRTSAKLIGENHFDYGHDAPDGYTNGSKVYIPAANQAPLARGRADSPFKKAKPAVVIIKGKLK